MTNPGVVHSRRSARARMRLAPAMGRLTAAVLALLAALVVLCAATPATAAAPETSDVTVYSSLDMQAPVQLITAQKKGFFKQFGLNVTIKYLQSATDIVPGMAGGSIVLAHGGLANPLLIADRGFPATVVSLVADYQRSSQLVVQKNVAGLAPADLAGKTLVGPDVPVMRMFWQNWAAANKLDPKSVKWLSMAPSDAVVAFNSKQADVLLAWAPHTTNAVKAGGVLWQDGHDSYRSGKAEAAPVYYNWGVVFGSTDWLRKNPRTLEAYLSALYMAQAYLKCHESEVAARLEPMHGILVPGGFGERGSEGKIASVRFARERKVPYFGICLGMQMACIEGARNLGGIKNASTTEFGATDEPVIGLITEWMSAEGLQKREAGGDLGGTMRLGAYPAKLAGNSHAAAIYGGTDISERHRHRYEVNINYREVMERGGLVFSGMSPDGQLPEVVERPDHPWFVGVQFHPELKSKPFDPHPLFASFIEAAVHQSRLV